MFEISIFCVILFAIAYWTTLFIMGRRDDVLHGEFVEMESELAPVPTDALMDVTVAEPVLPTTPATPPIIDPVPAPAPVAAAKPSPRPAPVAVARAPQPTLARTPANTEKLQSLLASIKQELKNAAQI
ncbi:MAG TPA: hypothetical protein VKR55_31620 [Bradyrhizobium sp.]|uniref:hypothetical protein n=1 Tax=Bradyrhizobium sp. TaxID=376 RepID=UPI002C7C5B51|nr:hypothetical protein [Bradyrhizobium sp.]HLZ06681.1 hypothetical protein [Bradyrhizobium sp.]